MQETAATETKPKTLETVVCGRCGGTGHYSYCQAHGTTCFGCSGNKRVYTKRGLKAKLHYEALLSKPASALQVGMKIRVTGVTNGGSPYTKFSKITRIDDNSVTRSCGFGDGKGGYIYDGLNIICEELGEMGIPPEKMFRVAATAEEKAAALAKALEFQDSLTKTGTVRKSKVKK